MAYLFLKALSKQVKVLKQPTDFICDIGIESLDVD